MFVFLLHLGSNLDESPLGLLPAICAVIANWGVTTLLRVPPLRADAAGVRSESCGLARQIAGGQKRPKGLSRRSTRVDTGMPCKGRRGNQGIWQGRKQRGILAGAPAFSSSSVCKTDLESPIAQHNRLLYPKAAQESNESSPKI